MHGASSISQEIFLSVFKMSKNGLYVASFSITLFHDIRYIIYIIYIYITLVAIYSFQFQMKISISATFTLLHARIRYYDGALHFTSSYVTCDLPVFRPNFSNPIAYRDKNLLTNVSVIYRYQSILRTVLRKIVYFLSIEVSKITITRTGY